MHSLRLPITPCAISPRLFSDAAKLIGWVNEAMGDILAEAA